MEGDDHVPYLGDPDPILDAVEAFVTGSRRPHEVDRILATVLFTDIVASTDVAALLGDARWRDVLEQHRALARAEVASGAVRPGDRRGGSPAGPVHLKGVPDERLLFAALVLAARALDTLAECR